LPPFPFESFHFRHAKKSRLLTSEHAATGTASCIIHYAYFFWSGCPCTSCLLETCKHHLLLPEFYFAPIHNRGYGGFFSDPVLFFFLPFSLLHPLLFSPCFFFPFLSPSFPNIEPLFCLTAFLTGVEYSPSFRF